MTTIQTTTAGSLPQTDRLIEANTARMFAADGFTFEQLAWAKLTSLGGGARIAAARV